MSNMTQISAKNWRLFTALSVLIGLNVALLVASNAAGAKMIAVFGGLAASATVFSYSITFAITDTISEVFGRRAAKLCVRISIVGALFSVLLYTIAIAAPAASFWTMQDAYAATLGNAPRILLGGFASYIVSQHLDVWLFEYFKRLTNGKHLWLRNNASTLISQFVDTVIFIKVAFYGVFPIQEAILGQYIIKVFIAGLDTPLVYLLTSQVRRYIDGPANKSHAEV